MARTVQDFKLNTRSARLKLTPKREPYWRDLQQGLAIGYRRGSGTWLGRYWDKSNGKYKHRSFGVADDVSDDATTFEDAQKAIRDWYGDLTRGANIDYTVNQALDDYINFLGKNRSESTAYDTKKRIDKHCRVLGHHKVNDLRNETINRWREGLVDWSQDDETVRKQKDTSNRVMTMLKAALNRSFANVRGIVSDAEWRKVKPYENVNQSRKVFLSEAQSQRLINTTQGEFKNLIIAALLTGCRYGELITAKAQDFDQDSLTITQGKTGARDVTLDDNGSLFFTRMCAGKKPDDLIFNRDDGKPWLKSHQQRLFTAAAKRAKLPAESVFYCLRHTYASQRLTNGINHQILAENMGTSIRMLEVHYGKFMKQHRREIMNATASKLELPESNLEAI